jgi:hypothetical protein
MFKDVKNPRQEETFRLAILIMVLFFLLIVGSFIYNIFLLFS